MTNSAIIRDMFEEVLRDDAALVYRQMQSPTVLRLRSEESEDAHPLLAMRLGRMEACREQMKNYAVRIIEGDQKLFDRLNSPVNGATTPIESNLLGLDIRRALEICMRVLECSDSSEVKQSVAETAHAISSSIGVIGTVLQARSHSMAEVFGEESLRASMIAENVESIAGELKEKYEQMRTELVRPEPRTPVHTEELRAAV